MKVSTEIDNNFGYEKITQLVNNIQITDIVPLFSNLSDLDKFFFIFRSNDYDINMCCIKGISEMYKYRNSLM